MAKSPAFQFYASDFLTDTQSWEIEEVGIYIRLLANQWVNGSLPNDLKRLSRIAGCDLETLKKAWVILGFKFFEDEHGFLHNLKLEEIRGKQMTFREKQVLNGLKGGRPKKTEPKQNPKETQTKPNENPNNKPNKSSSSSTSIKEKYKKEFEFFWNLYPNKIGKSKCEVKFQTLKQDDVLKIISTLEKFINYKPFKDYNHPHPMTYLNQERWNDVIPESKQLDERPGIYVPVIPM